MGWLLQYSEQLHLLLFCLSLQGGGAEMKSREAGESLFSSNRAVQRDARFSTNFALVLAMYIQDRTAAFHQRKIFKITCRLICRRPGCCIHAASLIETSSEPWTVSKGASRVRRAQFLWRHALHWTFFNSQRQIFHRWPDQVEPVGKLTTTKNPKKKKKTKKQHPKTISWIL